MKLSSIEKLALAILLFHLVWVVFYYTQLPQRIAIHFNGKGMADGWGNKSTLFLLPIISIANFALINWAKGRGKYNTHKPADPKEMAKMIDHLNLSCQIIFAIISVQVVRIALSQAQGLGIWFMPIFLVLIFYPFIFYFRATKDG